MGKGIISQDYTYMTSTVLYFTFLLIFFFFFLIVELRKGTGSKPSPVRSYICTRSSQLPAINRKTVFQNGCQQNKTF